MAVLKIALLGFLLFAVSSGQTSRGPILDKIIRDILEKVRPDLKDLEISDQQFNVTNNQMNITASLTEGLVKGLDKFVVKNLATTLIPLKVTNLTLIFDEVKFTGLYSLDGKANIPNLPGNLTLFGEGDAKIVLKDIFFTIAGDFVMKDGKFQIPPKGLYGFDINVSKCKVELKNLLGGGGMEKFINEFLGFFIPDLIRDYKKPFFETVRDPLIKLINDALAQEKSARRGMAL